MEWALDQGLEATSVQVHGGDAALMPNGPVRCDALTSHRLGVIYYGLTWNGKRCGIYIAIWWQMLVSIMHNKYISSIQIIANKAVNWAVT